MQMEEVLQSACGENLRPEVSASNASRTSSGEALPHTAQRNRRSRAHGSAGPGGIPCNTRAGTASRRVAAWCGLTAWCGRRGGCQSPAKKRAQQGGDSDRQGGADEHQREDGAFQHGAVRHPLRSLRAGGVALLTSQCRPHKAA